MSEFDQQPFGGASAAFIDNPEPRCPCILLLDVSYSMSGNPIDELNRGLETFRDELLSDDLAAKRVEIAVVTFGNNVTVDSGFVSAADFYPPRLSADGSTPMGEAIEKSLTLLKDRKAEYNANGVSYYRPWIFLITDGAPTDEGNYPNSAASISNGEQHKEFAFYAVGVEGANMQKLEEITTREPLRLRGLSFNELFQWLSSSLRSVADSNPGDAVALNSPEGWAVID